MTAGPLAPHRGRVARLLGPLQATGVFWYRFHWLLVRLPEPLLRAVLAVVVAGAYLVLPRVRRAIAHNQTVILGEASFYRRQRRVLRTLHLFSLVLTERYERLRGTRPFTAEFEGLEHWQQATGGGGGFVLITAHLGCWEVGSLLPQDQLDKVVHLVREPELDPRAQRFMARQVERQQGRRVTHFATDDATLGIELLQALRRGEVVALQSDRPRAGQGGRAVRLFDHMARLPHGPAALARAAEVPLLPVFVYLVRRRHYRVVFRPLIEVSSGTDRDADLDVAMTRIAGELEGAIRRAPEQWFCFAPVFAAATAPGRG